MLTNGDATDRDEQLIALLAEAREARERVLATPELTIKDIASASGQCRKRLARLFGIAYLAPDIVATILQGSPAAGAFHADVAHRQAPARLGSAKDVLGFA